MACRTDSATRGFLLENRRADREHSSGLGPNPRRTTSMSSRERAPCIGPHVERPLPFSIGRIGSLFWRNAVYVLSREPARRIGHVPERISQRVGATSRKNAHLTPAPPRVRQHQLAGRLSFEVRAIPRRPVAVKPAVDVIAHAAERHCAQCFRAAGWRLGATASPASSHARATGTRARGRGNRRLAESAASGCRTSSELLDGNVERVLVRDLRLVCRSRPVKRSRAGADRTVHRPPRSREADPPSRPVRLPSRSRPGPSDVRQSS